MQKLIITLSLSFSLIIPVFGAITNRVEIIKTCNKCNGSGSKDVFELCPTCRGRGTLSSTGRSSFYSYRTYVNHNTRCTTCGMSSRMGHIKVKTSCESCDGKGKVSTGKFREEIVYTEEEKATRRAKINKTNDLAVQNAKLIEEQKKRDIADRKMRKILNNAFIERQKKIGKYPCSECRKTYENKGYWRVHCKKCIPNNIE